MKKNKPRRWHAALHRIRNGQVLVAEIGVWQGHFSEMILRKRPNAQIVQVDRWQEYAPDESAGDPASKIAQGGQAIFDEAYDMNLARVAPFKDRVEILRMDSVEAAEKLANRIFDLIFVDDDHSYHGCLRTIKAWYPKVKKGGYIGGHDYPRRPGAVKAVHEMFSKVEKDYDNTWWVKI